MATLYAATGDTTHVQPTNGHHFTLDELYRFLDCDRVEIIPLWSDHLMVIDEKGRLKDNPRVNLLATQLFRLGRSCADMIVGPALVCRVEEAQ